ncbi:MAG TPA: DNA helicase RecQ [Acetobacteraceae bacterium]|jgi:ATP-dependent DNA helicase RecQ
MTALAETLELPDHAPDAVLKRVFGYPAFRGLQAQAVDHLLAGGDALVLMPTGGGKSICYQVPALCRPGTAIVISPLIALMDDQVAALRQLGIAAGALHSDLDPEEQRRVGRELDAGRLDLLYVSPERLLSPGTMDRLQRRDIALLAIDEAHCVSQWGHEFRPEYRELACLPQRFPGVPRVALTATADPRTRVDILASLGMSDARVFTASFHRPNLHIAAEAKVSETAQLLDLLRRHAGEAGIVYCGSRAKTERIAAWLAGKGIASVAFHAGLPADQKREAAARFRSGEAVVVVATIAFGMGIDRPDVRFVVHLDMADSPEAYYQQIGRAGRDGDASDTLLLYGGEDIARARYFLQNSAAAEEQKRSMRARLEAMISLTETVECRTRALLHCFGEELPGPCGHCDNCLSPVALFDGTTDAQKVLSAVYRTGQRFGGQHVIAVLRGESNPKIVQFGHDALPTYGVGADRPALYWRGVIRQLIAKGALTVETGEFATIALVMDKARPILRGEEKVMLRADIAAGSSGDRDRRRGSPDRNSRTRPAATEGLSAEGNTLFDAMRLWRSSEAKAQSVPPYVIFHDSTLREIAAVHPRSLDELAQIKGVGASKLARYGAGVLAALHGAG